MTFNTAIRSSVGADDAVSKHYSDDEIDPFTVTLSPFASLRETQRRAWRAEPRDASLRSA
jgi:hypothetical protein